MLDFNDALEVLAPAHDSNERDEIRAELLGRLESVLRTMMPAGKIRSKKFLVGDARGTPGESLEVVLEGNKAGLWMDRADDNGGDRHEQAAVGDRRVGLTELRCCEHSGDPCEEARQRESENARPLDRNAGEHRYVLSAADRID